MRGALWLTLVLVVLTVIAIGAHFSSTTLEFSRYNPQWNGTSQLFERFEGKAAVELHDFSTLPGYEDALLLIIAPEPSFSPEDIAAAKTFLQHGNAIFIADEEGEANAFLEGLGSSIRVVPGNLSSIDMEYDNPRTITVYPSQDDAMLDGVSTLTLNHPSALEGGEPLLSTSLLSWIDAQGDQRINSGEYLSRYCILSHEGGVYVLSDPSIFINAMLHARISGDNARFLDNILSNAPHLLIDQTHSKTAGEDGMLGVWNGAKNSIPLKIVALVISLILLVYFFSKKDDPGEFHG